MKILLNYILLILLAFISQSIVNAQNTENDPYAQGIKSYQNIKKEKHINYDTISKIFDQCDYGYFTIQPGIWIPIGDNNKIFEPSPNISFKLGFATTKENRFDLILSLTPTDSEKFTYYADDTTFTTTVASNIAINLSYAFVHKLQNNISIENYYGFGMAIITTNTYKEKDTSCKTSVGTVSYDNNNDDDCDDGRYSIETINFLAGLNLNLNINNQFNMGINFEFDFAPHSLMHNEVRNFGNSNLVIGVYVRL